MAVKYHCTKCSRRFIDWGAKKIGFMCPDCNQELVVLGGSTGKTKSKPSLRRPVAVSAAASRVSAFDDDGENLKAVPEATDEIETEGTDFDDDETEIDLGADDEEPAAAAESDD